MIIASDYTFSIGGQTGSFSTNRYWFEFDRKNGFNEFMLNNKPIIAYSNRVFYYGSPGLLKAFDGINCYVRMNNYVRKIKLEDLLWYADNGHNIQSHVIKIMNKKVLLFDESPNGNFIEIGDSLYAQNDNELEEIDNVFILKIKKARRKYKLRGRYKYRDLYWEE